MKSVAILKTLAAVACVTVACSVYAQDNSAASGAAAATTTKAAPAGKKADRKLGYTVRKALSKAQGIDVSNITVRSRSGAVTLTGSVPSQDQIDQAGQVAQGVAGVKSVTNKLTVMQQ
ncbi:MULTISPECIES: BON domain-containing protein [Paraburkholderia]|uniref:BON domain-containing protein n=1 Tax=Paraburkholderia tropica TaxID=92647 RepID=A0A1A5XP51_9BURK|nr:MULTISPECIES: BON domain-containing protein [Paraburkholderia]MBB2977383.1 osmotically-inducible protein OsmY [Paraburkholderia tropica]MBB2997752.1 osmotically-inducible protein OsmY [Paraburkholderia tropica]MBB6316774.1 osmotically-inducible protein OsmY [Paraburkholderia tropica]OBR54943.1 phospholipid-binding protein [Paraburkholderia tropica]PXX20790.1 BON domain-containing protein [Paraburkholderia tropica]